MHAFNICLWSPIYASDTLLGKTLIRLDHAHVAFIGSLLLGTHVAGGQGRLSSVLLTGTGLSNSDSSICPGKPSLESDFEGPVPVSKTDEGEGRELRLADSKA